MLVQLWTMCVFFISLMFKEKKIFAQACFTVLSHSLAYLAAVCTELFCCICWACSGEVANGWCFNHVPLPTIQPCVIMFLFPNKLLELCDYVIRILIFIKNKEKELYMAVFFLYSLSEIYTKCSRHSLLECWTQECVLNRVNISKEKDNNLSSPLEVKPLECRGLSVAVLSLYS